MRFILILFFLIDFNSLFKNKEYLDWPLKNGMITSTPGRRWNGIHFGIDIATKKGTNVFSAGTGIVNKVYYNEVFGNRIEIYHSFNGITTTYSHLKKVFVKKNQKVNKNIVIGEIGTTGKSTGPHLHFEVLHTIVFLNPLSVLPSHNFTKEYYIAYLKSEKSYTLD